MKIAFFEIVNGEEEYLKERFKGHEVIFFKDILNEKTLKSVEDADVISVFIYSKINKEILDKLEKLKAIATRSTGFDHINIAECKKRKILVLNVPRYAENTTAEHTFALILALSRKIPKSHERTMRGNFSLENLEGFDLKDKTLGIIGTGNIGQNVIKIAKGFGMKVIAFDVKKDLKLAGKLDFKYVLFDNLLKNSDIISLHCPYNKKTHHLINNKNIKLIKKGAYLINTARGGLIDTHALVNALVRKDLGGAGLDVLEEEFMIKEERELLSKNFPKERLKNLLGSHLLLTFENVVITPHNAFNSKESAQRILDTTIDNIKCLITKKCENKVIK